MSFREAMLIADLKAITPGLLKNCHLLEILCHVRNTKPTWSDVKLALSHAYGQDWSDMSTASLACMFTGL